MWSVTGGDFGFEAGQIIGFHNHFLIIPILIHCPFSWLRFGGVLIHIAQKTPDQHLLPNPGASQDLLKKKNNGKFTTRIQIPKNSSLKVFRPFSVSLHGNNLGCFPSNSWDMKV